MGIGRAFCFGLAEEGAKVVAADINLEGAEKTVKELQEQRKEAQAIRTDVSDEKSVTEMVQNTVKRFGKVDILINNAALFTALGPAKPWTKIDVTEWDKVMAVNLKGLFLCSRAVVPHMLSQGWGRIINVSSALAYKGIAGRLHYVTSKAGVLGFTRGLARELAGTNITVNSIGLGQTMSEGLINRGDVTPESISRLKAQRCVQREIYPKDIVGTVVFLASDDSEFICGQTIIADGGIVFI